MSAQDSMYHISGLENRSTSLLHCGRELPGGGVCFGVMMLTQSLPSHATTGVYVNATRETWECCHCHGRQFIWAYEAKGGEPVESPKDQSQSDANPSGQERLFCITCRNEYPAIQDDELHMCEPCALWYRMQTYPC